MSDKDKTKTFDEIIAESEHLQKLMEQAHQVMANVVTLSSKDAEFATERAEQRLEEQRLQHETTKLALEEQRLGLERKKMELEHDNKILKEIATALGKLAVSHKTHAEIDTILRTVEAHKRGLSRGY